MTKATTGIDKTADYKTSMGRTFRKLTAGLCIGLTLAISTPRAAKAEPITVMTALKILGIVLSAGGIWVSVQSVARAEHNSATETILKHLEDDNEFPVGGVCVSPDIRNGTLKEGWLVSIDNKEHLKPVIESMFCDKGGLEIEGKYAIGVFSNKYLAEQFGKVVKHRTDHDIDVYVSKQAMDVSEAF